MRNPDPGANRTEDPAPREIVVVKPSSLGDIVHTLPAVALLKRRWPQAKIRWVINAEWAPLLEENPGVDEVLIFPRGDFHGFAGWLKIPPWARRLRQRAQADLVVDFQGLLRSALIARLCRRESGTVFGRSDAREGAQLFYDRMIEAPVGAHAVDRYLALAHAVMEKAGSAAAANPAGRGEPLDWPLPQGRWPQTCLVQTPFILLHPFARGAGKSLPVNDLAELCRALAPERIVIVGKSNAGIPPLPHVVDMLNMTSLPELIGLIRRASYVVSVDSGPMHIAAAITDRVVAIHRSSDPELVGPYSRNAWIWKEGALFHRGDAERLPVPDLPALAKFLQEQM